MKKETVDEYMQTNVVTIDINETVKNAKKKMDDYKLHKLIALQNSVPKFILKKWDLIGLDDDVVIKDIKEQLELAYVITSGTILSNVYENLEERSALIIKKDDKMIGVITSSDLNITKKI